MEYYFIKQSTPDCLLYMDLRRAGTSNKHAKAAT